MSRGAGKPIRVLHLRDTDKMCGPGKTICETARLNPDPDVSYVVAAFGNSRDNGFLRRAGELCPVLGLPPSRAAFPWSALRLRRLAAARAISLVHAHDFKTDVLGLLVGRAARLPVVTTVHGYITVSGKSRTYAAADRFLLRRMDRVVAVSQAMRDGFVERGLEGSRVCLIRNCIAVADYPFGYRSDALASSGVGLGGDRVIGHVGRLSPEKGQRQLVEVFPEILRRIPGARLVLVGDGPDLAPLRARASDPAYAGRVHLLGHRSDIREVYGGLDLLVLNSDTEGLPNVILEAMALGVPVVATAVGGTPELVTDGVTGLVVERRNPKALVEVIAAALENREAAAAMAARARERVAREFDMSVLIRLTHEMYRELMRGWP